MRGSLFLSGAIAIWVIFLAELFPVSASEKLGNDLPFAVRTVLAEAGTHLTKGEAEKALAVLTRFQQQHPDQKHALLSFYLGNAWLQAKKPGKAEDFRLLGDLYANLHLPMPAARAYASARQKGDKNPDLFLKEARMLQAATFYSQALEKVREGARQGADPAIWQIAMHIHMAENRYGEAFEAGCMYEKAKKKTDSDLLLPLGYCAYRAGKTDRALQYLHRIPEKDRRHHEEAFRMITFLKAEKTGKDES